MTTIGGKINLLCLLILDEYFRKFACNFANFFVGKILMYTYFLFSKFFLIKKIF